MWKHVTIPILALCFYSISVFSGKIPSKPDSLKTFLQIKDANTRQKNVSDLLVHRFLYTPANDVKVKQYLDTIAQYDNENVTLYRSLINILVYRRRYEYNKADKSLKNAISLAIEQHNDLMLYIFYTNRAYLHTNMSDPTGAVYNYRKAHQLAIKLKDERYQINSYLGLSDIYYKIGLYDRSLYYLRQISEYCARDRNMDKQFCATVTYNKAENFFRMGNADSLTYYRNKLNTYNDTFYDIERLRLRLSYYQLLLAQQYSKAIPVIRAVLNDSTKYDTEIDYWHLANTYYNIGRPDSAKTILQRLLSGGIANKRQHHDHRYYDLLAKIAEQKGDHQAAYQHSARALYLSKKLMTDLALVASISSDIRADQIEDNYQTKALEYQKERMMLIFGIVLAVLVTIIIAMFYYSAKQQRRYETLLYTSKHEELAFINSHEVRKHLSNILGLCQMLKDSDVNAEELITYNEYLQRSATDLDEAIKSIEHKLSERN